MSRYSIDCPEAPSDDNWNVKISGSEEHLVEAAVVHMVTHHGHADMPDLHEAILSTMKPEADE